MQSIYVFSGLGVDGRIFKNIDFGTFKPHFVDWIPPLENETLEAYAYRISRIIQEEEPIVIGLSFGGMIAVEISKIIPVRKLILIASAKNINEIPRIYRWAGSMGLHKIAPHELMKKTYFLGYHLFGIRRTEDKKLFRAIMEDTDVHFLKWALQAILHWQNTESPAQFTHIHGDQDRILPIQHIQTSHVIPGGGHFMTVDKAEEIGKILQEILNP